MQSKKIFLTEEHLVSALKNQKWIGMKALIDMYSESLGGVIYKIVQDSELSKDTLQEVFIKIWYSIHKYESSKGRLFTWMINLARNYSFDTLRSKRYRNGKLNTDIDDCRVYLEKDNRIIYNPDTILIKEMVDQLKPEFIIVLQMVYFKGYTHVEVADELNIPLGTVKTRIRMAILELRSQFN